MPRGRLDVLGRQARELASGILLYMKKEAEEGLQYDVRMVQMRTAAATGVSLSTVRRIIKEAKKDRNTNSSKRPVFRTPGKKRTGKRNITGLTCSEICVVKRCIHNFHRTEKELPTTHRLLKKLRRVIGYKGSATSLRTILKRLGFKFEKSYRQTDTKKILIESANIRLKRIEFLKKLSKYRQEGRPIIYTDESYVDSSHTKPKKKENLSHLQRVGIIHAGSENGFVPNALLLSKADTKTADYNKMKHKNYEKWLHTKLIPNLPENSVVVVDNGSYHTKLDERVPTSNSSKSDMEAWLREKNISFGPSLLKPELYELICINKENHEKYLIDNILRAHNHSVLRLPPRHPELNPIKMAWAEIRTYISQKKVTWNIDEIMKLVEEKVNAMGESDWSGLCKKVREIEEEYKENDVRIDRMTETYNIVQISDNESSDELETESEDSDESDESDISFSSGEDAPSSGQEEIDTETEKPEPG